MQAVTLPGSGRHTSQLGFGCSGIMGAVGRRRSLQLLEAAFDAGIRHYDVAPLYGYGAAEGCLGEFASRHAGHITITTKFGLAAPPRPGLLRSLRRAAHPLLQRFPQLQHRLRRAAAPATAPTRLPFSVTRVQESLEQSLRALRTGYLDLFLLHELDSTDAIDPDLQQFLEAARQAGKIGGFGCASARASIPSLHAMQPGLCEVLAYNWAPNRLLPEIPAFRVQHRALAEYLPSLPKRAFAEADIQTASPAQILLRAALLAEPGGMVLFSSTDTAHIRSCVDAATRPDLAAPAARLLAFLQSAELSVHRSTLANVAGAGYPEGHT